MDELWLSLSLTVSVIALYCSSGPYFSNGIQLFFNIAGSSSAEIIFVGINAIDPCLHYNCNLDSWKSSSKSLRIPVVYCMNVIYIFVLFFKF